MKVDFAALEEFRQAQTKAEIARELPNWFSYEPETGLIRWIRKPARNVDVGSVAGFRFRRKTSRVTYIYVQLAGRWIAAHNIAWTISSGSWPKGEVDHADGDGLNNRLNNLRDGSHQDNCRNQPLPRTNTSGRIGIRFRDGKWQARITVNRRERHLGLFSTKEEAIACRLSAESEFGFHHNHGRKPE